MYSAGWGMKGKKLSVKERIAKLEQDKKFRRQIFSDLCAHVRKGYSVDCFSAIPTKSIYNYLKAYPDEFVWEELEAAKQDGRVWWETIGHRQASGDCLGNSRTWQYNMINRYGWRDKIEVEAEHKGTVQVNVISYAQSKQCKSECEKE
jgi:hypothetical protein